MSQSKVTKGKSEVWTLRIKAKKPLIFKSFQFENYVDEYNVARDLKDARGNVVVVGLIITNLFSKLRSDVPAEADIIAWLLDHPKIKKGIKAVLVNEMDQKDIEMEADISSAELNAKVIGLDPAKTKLICGAMDYNYNANVKTRRTMLIRAAKNYSAEVTSPFQKLLRVIDATDNEMYLLVRELLEHKVISIENGVFIFTPEGGSTSRMGISTDQVIVFLGEHADLHATLKSFLREAKKNK